MSWGYAQAMIYALILLFSVWTSHAFAGASLPEPPAQHHAEGLPSEQSTVDHRDVRERMTPDLSKADAVRSYTKPDGVVMTEYSMNGRVYMVKVQPVGDVPAYYVYDSDGDGSMDRRMTGAYKGSSSVLWEVHKF